MRQSKMVVIIYPREKKLTKPQLVHQVAINACMSLVSVSGTIEGDRLAFSLITELEETGIPRNWFMGGSHFHTEAKRVLQAEEVDTIYHWCNQEEIPASRGELDGEGSVLVVGPYWANLIDDIIERSVAGDSSVREYGEEGEYLPKNS